MKTELPPLKDKMERELCVGDHVAVVGLFDWTPTGYNHGTVVAVDVKNVYQVGGHILVEFPDGTGRQWVYHPKGVVRLLNVIPAK